MGSVGSMGGPAPGSQRMFPQNQGMMGMNMSMNMGMTTPVMMGGVGMPGVGMGLSHSISPAVVPPKQDAFANFGNFGK